MRPVSLILLLLLSTLLAGCTLGSDFVVANASSRQIEVRYMIRWLMNEPFSQIGKPATLAVSQMQSGEWRELSPDQYAFDRSSRIATVLLKPGDALRILTRTFRDGNVGEEKDFIIEELHIRDVSGGVSLTGDRVNKSFLPAPRLFWPETTFVFTYK